ncbi:UNVERIFIED_CONTAM: hypothetical protein DQE83_26130 [Escherichia coli]
MVCVDNTSQKQPTNMSSLTFFIFCLQLFIFTSTVSGISIKRCTEEENNTWEIEVGLCIQTENFRAIKTGCYKIQGPGGLLTEGNGFKIFAHDDCSKEKTQNNFILDSVNEAVYALGKYVYMEISTSNITTLNSLPQCAKRISLSISCDQVTTEMKSYVESVSFKDYDLEFVITTDISCVKHVSSSVIVRNECEKKYISTGKKIFGFNNKIDCSAVKFSEHVNYLKTCSVGKFDRKKYYEHQHNYIKKIFHHNEL